MKLNF